MMCVYGEEKEQRDAKGKIGAFLRVVREMVGGVKDRLGQWPENSAVNASNTSQHLSTQSHTLGTLNMA